MNGSPLSLCKYVYQCSVPSTHMSIKQLHKVFTSHTVLLITLINICVLIMDVLNSVSYIVHAHETYVPYLELII